VRVQDYSLFCNGATWFTGRGILPVFSTLRTLGNLGSCCGVRSKEIAGSISVRTRQPSVAMLVTRNHTRRNQVLGASATAPSSAIPPRACPFIDWAFTAYHSLASSVGASLGIPPIAHALVRCPNGLLCPEGHGLRRLRQCKDLFRGLFQLWLGNGTAR
jgi:hypothetical protein